MNAYWRLRHFLWDVREWLYVRETMRHMDRSVVLYVHPLCGGPATCAVVRLDEVVLMLHPSDWHSHVEGRRRA